MTGGGRTGGEGRAVGETDAVGCRSSKSTDPVDSAGHDDERADGESRAVGIKSSPNIGVPDRRGRELINCRNGGYGGARRVGGAEGGGRGQESDGRSRVTRR